MYNAAVARNSALTPGIPLPAESGSAPQIPRLPGGADPAARLRSWLTGVDWAKLGVLVGLLLFAAAAFVLYEILEKVSWADVKASLERVPAVDIIAAIVATAGSYLALVGYDALALRQTGPHAVSLRFTALTSFISHALTFTLGFGVLTGGAVRLRLYQFCGLEPGRVLAVGVLCGMIFWMGLAVLAGGCLLLEPRAFAAAGIGPVTSIAAGAVILGAFAAWIGFTAIKPRQLIIEGWKLDLPGPAASLGSALIGVADTAMAALALWMLLPQTADVPFAGFLVIFAAATVLSVASHVPGGLGIFEAVILLAFPQLPPGDAIGALVLFRLIYYVAPFALATGLLLGFEAYARPKALTAAQQAFGQVVRPLLAPIAAVSVGAFGALGSLFARAMGRKA
jgi:phosphatidylglycerol lysyltransferase